MNEVPFQMTIIIDNEEYRCAKAMMPQEEKDKTINYFYNNINTIDKLKYELENGSKIFLSKKLLEKAIIIIK